MLLSPPFRTELADDGAALVFTFATAPAPDAAPNVVARHLAVKVPVLALLATDVLDEAAPAEPETPEEPAPGTPEEPAPVEPDALTPDPSGD